MNGEKNYVPGTNPEWGKELPEGMTNSIVDGSGKPWDNGQNFDEWDDEKDVENQDEKKEILSGEQITFDDLAKQGEFDPEAARKAREEGRLSVDSTEVSSENPR